MKKATPPTPVAVAATATRRRRPAQSRALVTTEAIQQAFIQLLVERGYRAVSIRQIVALAGVGTGSFYEYYSSKDELAAVCIRLRIRNIAAAMRDCIDAHRNEPLPQRVDALIHAQSAAPLADPEQWSALFVLERRISEMETYRNLYGEFVRMWTKALAGGPGWPDGAPIQDAAFAAHSMVYGLVTQALITRTIPPDAEAIGQLLRTTVHGYLSVVAPLAYRLYRFA
ncbi:HTH tetR-type domain-containing protein [Paraburkholderia sacchari]|uniref:TetR/AcrR family transcriptional regulator n=1 Tax=Paraburkholderia sacchari TaxID=159450 RepID=UPI0039A705E0